MAEIFNFSTFPKKKKKKKRVIEVTATKNYIKDKMTGGVDLLLRIFGEIAQSVKLKSQVNF